jgi:hypothetical protein
MTPIFSIVSMCANFTDNLSEYSEEAAKTRLCSLSSKTINPIRELSDEFRSKGNDLLEDGL